MASQYEDRLIRLADLGDEEAIRQLDRLRSRSGDEQLHWAHKIRFMPKGEVDEELASSVYYSIFDRGVAIDELRDALDATSLEMLMAILGDTNDGPVMEMLEPIIERKLITSLDWAERRLAPGSDVSDALILDVAQWIIRRRHVGEAIYDRLMRAQHDTVITIFHMLQDGSEGIEDSETALEWMMVYDGNTGYDVTCGGEDEPRRRFLHARLLFIEDLDEQSSCLQAAMWDFSSFNFTEAGETAQIRGVAWRDHYTMQIRRRDGLRFTDVERNRILEHLESLIGHSRSIRLDFDTSVFQQYWWGQGDPLYSVLSRVRSEEYVVVATEDEISRLREVANEIIESEGRSEEDKKGAEGDDEEVGEDTGPSESDIEAAYQMLEALGD